MGLRTILALGLWLAASESLAATPDIEPAEQLLRNTLELEGRAKRGAELFRTQCLSCHGAGARGNARELVPSLAGQRRAYLIKQLADFALAERLATAMHAVVVRSKVSDPQAWADVALYLNSLPVLARPGAGSGQHLAAGEAAYQKWCAGCHEDDARGDDAGFVPSLRNQHYEYLVREMRVIAAGHRFGLDPEMMQILTELEPDESTGIADYLARMRGPVRDRSRLQNDGSSSN